MIPQRTSLSRFPPADRDISIDYLRAFATVLVIAIHSAVAYSHLAQKAFWQSPIPILDTAHSALLDCLLCFLDVSTMSLMFFISGLFVYPGLQKRGSFVFIRDRALRLGLPFLAMTLLWMPAAYYAPWNLEHPGGTFARFFFVNARAHFSAGPGWFLWLLLFFDCILAALYSVSGGVMPKLARRLRDMNTDRAPALWALLMVLAGCLLYVPAALRYAIMWLPFVVSPFMVQPSRALFYAAWLVAGCIVGSAGLGHGLLSREGSLARRWPVWVLLGFAAGAALWLASSRPALHPSLAQSVLLGILWVLADVGICFGLLALFRGCVFQRRAWIDSLTRHAYAIYALHYVFALWIERWLLPLRYPALAKFSLALVGTLALSWLLAAALAGLWSSILVHLRMGPNRHASALPSWEPAQGPSKTIQPKASRHA